MLAWTSKEHVPTKARFKKDTGVDVIQTTFNDNEEAFGKLKTAGTSAYDTVFMDGLWCLEYLRANLTEPLDFPNWTIAPEFFPSFAAYDPWMVQGGMAAMPHAWSPYGIIYNTKYVKEEPTSFDVFFDPKYEGRVALRGNVNRNFLMTAAMQGFEDYEVDTPEGSRWHLPDDILKRAKDELIRSKKNFKLMWKSGGELTRALASEEVWLAFGNNFRPLVVGDAGNPNCEFTVPKEKTIGWVDGAMVVKDAAHKDAVIAWLQMWGGKEAQAAIVAETWEATSNKAALDLLKDQGHGERLDKLKAYKAAEWPSQFSLFRPTKVPSIFQDAYAEFMAA